MRYIIRTTNAINLKNTILSFVEKKKDSRGDDIRTWDVETLHKFKEKVLIHVTDQWRDKGIIHLTPSEDNKVLEVEFYYWSSYEKEDRSGDEDKYLYGRFTELLLVHFWKTGLRVEIA